MAPMRPRWHPLSYADRLPLLRRRGLLTQATRAFFLARGYLEVETPYAVAAPGEEVHVRAFATEFARPNGEATPLWLQHEPGICNEAPSGGACWADLPVGSRLA